MRDLMKAAIEGRIRVKIAGMEAELKSDEVVADVVKADRKNRTDTDIAVMNAVKALDTEEMKERAALEREDKRVVSIKQAQDEKKRQKESKKKAEADAKARASSSKLSLKEAEDGTVQGEHKGKKVLIKPE
jgi:UPF0288 family protein (methanogenesis marker protein 3)